MSLWKKYVLVMSWWGSKCFYSLWVIKAIEELWLSDEIEAVFWVSAWAMIWCYWAAGYDANQIFSNYLENINLLSAKNMKLPPVSSLIQEKPVLKMYKKDLPSDFSKLNKKVYIWTSDLSSWTYVLFDSGELIPPLMWSISLPVVFPPVNYQNYKLADGWIIDNFPVLRAKEIYPNHEIIWITVSTFQKWQKVSNVLSTAITAFNLALSKDIEWNVAATDHLFLKNTWISTTETNKKKILEIYQIWYKDWYNYFGARTLE